MPGRRSDTEIQTVTRAWQAASAQPQETASYIKHHLTIAGRSDPLFSDDEIAIFGETNLPVTKIQ
ncbi:hypothetical protein ACWCXH_39195 [Kitasatospora sp. NPDC001660]